MSLTWAYRDDSNPFKVSARQWSHASTTSIASKKCNPWGQVKQVHVDMRARVQSQSPLPLPKKQKCNRMPTDHGASGFGCGVRTPEGTLPVNLAQFSEELPFGKIEKTKSFRTLRWQREHLLLTSKHLPDRVPLPDKGKPVARRGRKATDQISDLTAGLPEEE